jgi:hypothetical protein
MKQDIKIRVKTIEKNGDRAMTNFNWDPHLVPKCGLVEPFIKLNIKETKCKKILALLKNT